MKKLGGLGLEMMYQTCTVQANFDFTSEEDMRRKVKIGTAIQPIVTGLFANSPFKDGKVFLCNSGSEANDTMVKMLWMLNKMKGNPQKRKIITRINGYHGVTLGVISPAENSNDQRDTKRHGEINQKYPRWNPIVS